MQDPELNPRGSSWSEDVSGSLDQAVMLQRRHLFSPNHDDVLVLRSSYADRARTMWLPAVALVASFGLGWAGGQHWPEFATLVGLGPTAETQAPSLRTSEARAGGRSEPVRKARVASALQSPGATMGAGVAAKLAHSSADSTGTIPSGYETSAARAVVAAAERPVLTPAPETRPTTIPGWTVVDVRDGTAVLEGPDGIRMAGRGDTLPGIGRVESIVRWGNRWIVATVSGLIATP